MVTINPRTGLGSSPRMRGAHVTHTVVGLHPRIIPAYAGSTQAAGRPWHPAQDHPRVCGEHSLEIVQFLRKLGSSPRMRGALHMAAPRKDQRGIIPAYAGSTFKSFLRSALIGDHPRVCGEHVVSPEMLPSLPGSSPRMRGALTSS